MDSSDVVASIVVISATILGAVSMWKDGDGTVLSVVVGMWGTVLGYVFGKKVATVALEAKQNAG